MFHMLIFKMSLVLFPSFPMFYASSVAPVPTTRLPLQRTLKQVLWRYSTTLMVLLKERGTFPSPYACVNKFPASLYPNACIFSYSTTSHHTLLHFPLNIILLIFCVVTQPLDLQYLVNTYCSINKVEYNVFDMLVNIFIISIFPSTFLNLKNSCIETIHITYNLPI